MIPRFTRYTDHRSTTRHPELRAAVEGGIGISEMQPYKLRQDMVELEKIVTWLDGWQERRKRTADTSVIERLPNVTVLRKPGFGNS